MQTWDKFNIEPSKYHLRKAQNIEAVNPLISTRWDQGDPYNRLVPISSTFLGITSHCPTGCVATAMAQIMRYHSYPLHGVGSDSYTEPENRDDQGNITYPSQGTLSANFSTTTYDWQNMPNELSGLPIIGSSATEINEVDTLMYHCGIALHMDYAPGGSGAATSRARDAYVQFFDYSIEATYISRGDCNTNEQWVEIMKEELDSHRPVHYRGDGTGGHSFVLDGYQGTDHFHFNWGWGGSSDGYFFLNALTPGSSNFTSSQGAIIKIIPQHTGLALTTPVLWVNQKKWEAPKGGGTSSPICVLNSNPKSTTTISYNVVSDVAWLTTSASSGSTAGSFTITASSNSSNSTRTGHITVTATTTGVYKSPITITITQPPSGAISHAVDVALVIDRSGSMSGSKIASAKVAASTFVGFMQTGDNIAVVSFDDVVEVNFPLTNITSDATKIAAQNAINTLYDRNMTSIGGGIRAGQGELNKGRTQSHQGMVLLSDGLENTAPWVADVLPTIPANTDIYTIALGNDADQTLLNGIATQTGGSYYFAPTDLDLQQIYNTIRGIITNQQTFSTFPGTISQGSTQSYVAAIDALTDYAVFSVTYQSGNIDMELVTPSGTTINSNNVGNYPNITYSKGSTYVFYNVQQPQSGNWSIKVIGTSIPYSSDYTATVQGTSTLTMNAYLDKQNFEQHQPITIYTDLMAQKSPVTGANIKVNIQKPTSSLAAFKQTHKSYFESRNEQPPLKLDPSNLSYIIDSLILYDDGIHGDGAANDGLYANLYSNTDNDGSYTFTVIASGSNPSVGDFNREFTFSTVVRQSTRPAAPMLLSIPNGSQQVPTNLTLRWNRNDTTVYANLRVSTLLSSSQSATMLTIIDTLVSADSLQIYGLESGKSYYWRVRSVKISYYTTQMSDWSPEWSFTTQRDIQGKTVCYPNPFNPSSEEVKLVFRVEKVGNISIKIYDITNNLVKDVLHDQQYTIGVGEASWNGKNDKGELVANGVYFYVVESSSGDRAIGKVAVLR
jgi:Mg-chelatase subunit ChlD